ncbi:MAG TPA: 4-hydroxybenzoate 3-monooxygenase [Stellaceae bacterium]|nr:4-hydroxybenzoate 3-monooxygenase [Stellaceae bacterium]
MERRTQVAIIGGGPAGLLLAQLLDLVSVESIVLERQTRAHVEARIRAGVLEPGTVAVLEHAGVAARLHRERLVHTAFNLAFGGEVLRIDLAAHAGGAMTVYGQTEITKDLIDARVARGASPVFEALDVAIHDVETASPVVTYRKDGVDSRIRCDFVAGCDGFHGVARATIPPSVLRTYERVYPFGWLGILADVPPCARELTYSNHERGFALASMRSATRSRYYVQCPMGEDLAAWPDERIWDELALRLGPLAAGMARGPSIGKGIAPLRSFVAEPMRHGRLFLAGDAAHIVPPTGAKGLNLAVADVSQLTAALAAYYQGQGTAALDSYSAVALARVWKAERFSWWLTGLTHRFPDADAFSRKMQTAEFEYIRQSRAAQVVIAENYVGLPSPALA